jgi:hypothetical protein
MFEAGGGWWAREEKASEKAKKFHPRVTFNSYNVCAGCLVGLGDTSRLLLLLGLTRAVKKKYWNRKVHLYTRSLLWKYAGGGGARADNMQTRSRSLLPVKFPRSRFDCRWLLNISPPVGC